MAGGLRRGEAQDDGAVLQRDGAELALAIVDGWVAALGTKDEVRERLRGLEIEMAELSVLDCPGQTITPGLIDPHTHLLHAGTREGELKMRQEGRAYLEILEAGGGILSTVERTREATPGELLAHGRRWLREMLSHGVTTAEVKSGYGLDLDTELRLLEASSILAGEGGVEVIPTFMGAHAVPPEFQARGGAASYARSVIEEQLPAVARQGVARFCDVFCEPEVFDVELSRAVLEQGAALGLRPRLHADELADSGGAALAAEIGAVSADHLAAVSEAGIEALARAAQESRPVVATLLPATSFYLMSERYAPARALIERSVPVALGTDFNPGTSPTPNLPLVLSIATIKLGMTGTEALSAVTVNAAHAVGLGESHGSLAEGRVGDLVVWDVPRHALIPYWMGANLVRTVVKGGRVAFNP